MIKDKSNKPANPSRRMMISTSLAVALGSRFNFVVPANAEETKPMLKFVQLSEGFKLDEGAGAIRLVNVSPHTLYFADRPERIAGHIKMGAYFEEWTSKAGKDNFGNDPPNAALSVYEPGKPTNAVAVIEITNPRIEGRDLVYACKSIDGKLPPMGQETALFIDWIGVGSGAASALASMVSASVSAVRAPARFAERRTCDAVEKVGACYEGSQVFRRDSGFSFSAYAPFLELHRAASYR